MQLPDESIAFHFSNAIVPFTDTWTPLAELQHTHLITPERFDSLKQQMMNVRMQIAGEREMNNPPAKLRPLEPGFIDYPLRTLDQYRRKSEGSELGKILSHANRLKSFVDRIVIVGAGGGYLGPRCLFESLCSRFHNELPVKTRIGRPRIYFTGHSPDNDSLQDLLEMLENTCVDPDLLEERWGVIVINRSHEMIEPTITYRILRSELTRYYGNDWEKVRKLILPVTTSGSKFRDLCLAEKFSEDDFFTLPDNVNDRFSVFTATGLLPAAVMGLDVQALLLGAATMTKRFFDEPFERNPVLHFAALNYLFSEEQGKKQRILTVSSPKLEAIGWWYDQLIAESLGKQNRGSTPATLVHGRDLYARGQQILDGTRDKLIHHLIIQNHKHPPIPIGMADRNEDDLNGISRKTFPDVSDACHQTTVAQLRESARPSTEIQLPSLCEHAIGQLLQMLMLATVVEARLMGVNPYSQPGIESNRKQFHRQLRGGGV